MKHLKKSLLVIVFFISTAASADEGMWLPQLLGTLNEKQMKSLGMKISAADIYSVNKGSLKDAVVSLGGFCTGEVISQKGLVLTNHHCGFGLIQNHSTIDNNYIRDGFWAKQNTGELPNPGLYVTFIIRIDDITKQAVKGLAPDMSEKDRQSTIDKNIDEARKNTKKEPWQNTLVKGFYENNQYYLFVTETFRDVRLVGAPPSSIGNFGSDTDNWMWPRHTGDFSLFRIYAGKDNKPAAYSPDNVPYVPRRAFSISMDGLNENDFTMVFGFPGITNEYLSSSAVEQIIQVNNPAKIRVREKILSVMNDFMRKDEKIKIQYAAKYLSIQNRYKRWQGEMLGLLRTDGVGKKKAYETEFTKRVNANPTWKSKYGALLDDLAAAYAEIKNFGFARDYYNEIIPRIELFNIASRLNTLVSAFDKDGEKGYQRVLPGEKEKLDSIYQEYNATLDQKQFETLVKLYLSDQEKKNVSPALLSLLEKEEGSFEKLAAKVYNSTDLDDGSITLARLGQPSTDVIQYIRNNVALSVYNDILRTYQSQVRVKLDEIQSKVNGLQRTYMQAQLEVFREKKFYPDANGTLRLTYGVVKGYNARDAVQFDQYTWLDGVMEKYKPGDYEFDVPEKLRTLYRQKEYGAYGVNGKMPVCFIASNHTSGGNSGSPVLDAYGNLVGINFDRAWEGTMSDINYDPSICRNISVDIRYILFIIDKFAGAGYLVSEMKLVHPRKNKK